MISSERCDVALAGPRDSLGLRRRISCAVLLVSYPSQLQRPVDQVEKWRC